MLDMHHAVVMLVSKCFDVLNVGITVGYCSTSHSPTCLIGLHWSPATPLDIQPGGAGVHWSPVETQWTPTKSSPPQPTPIGLQPKSNQVQPTLSRLQGEMFGSDWTPTRLQLESNETLATSVFYATVGCVRNHYLSHSCHKLSSHSYQTPWTPI